MPNDNVRELRPRSEPDASDLQTCACGEAWLEAAVCVDSTGRVVARAIVGTCSSCGEQRAIGAGETR